MIMMDDKERRAILLDKAANICVWQHAGQRDKNGDAYFMHPMRVALKCQTDEEKIVALLHDVLEDTDYTVDNLRSESFPDHIIDAVACITKDRKESYEDFIHRVKTNSLARVVKIHDLEDNLDTLRLDSFNPELAALFTKYIATRQFLLKEELTGESLGKDAEDSLEVGTEQETKEESIDDGKMTENVHLPSDDDEEDEEDCVRYEVKRIVLSREQSHRDQRARINRRLSNNSSLKI